ncbi:MAG TPA: AAA family ATPase, partial [Kofleriaceae bacterium]|nr:AAA family ATPase [Kofleriaceae bacterium]
MMLTSSPTYRDASPAARRAMSLAFEHHEVTDGELRVALWRAGVPFGEREHACAIVRHLKLPTTGLEARDPLRLARLVSLAVRHDWLVAVAGALAATPADAEACALWAEHCREHGIFDRAQPFASAHTRRCFVETNRPPDVIAHDDTTCEVLVMSGLPAAGKDTYLAARALPVISLDAIRDELAVDPADNQGSVVTAAREQARVYLRDEQPFAWNATNLSRMHRAAILELVRAYRGRTHLIYCEATATEQRARNRARRDSVPSSAIERMLERWTVPDPS